jgi:hypothetical protein
MSSKRFVTRRQWHNLMLMLWTIPFLLLVGVIVFAATGRFAVLITLSLVGLVGGLVALYRDMSDRVSYIVKGEELILKNGTRELVVPLADVLDVSLIDRAGAREYILSTFRKEGGTSLFDRKRASKRFVQFSSVDIGLNSLTLGLGRAMTDRMPNARHDLVLLRLRSGGTFFLSPLYNQDFVAMIGRRTLTKH